MNHYYPDLGSRWITAAQTLAPNESLLHRLKRQMNHYCTDSGSKWITTAQTQAPNESLLHRLRLQMNHYYADLGSRWITAAQTLAPNESLLCRLKLQMNHYCADLSSKWITALKTRAPDESLLRRRGLQKTSLAQAGSGHTGTFWLHFSIVAGSKDTSPIFFLQSMTRVTGVTVNTLRYAAVQVFYYCTLTGVEYIK